MIWWRGFINRSLIRLLDIFFSFAGIIVLSPLMVVIAILILTGSKGPVFFRQARVGKDNIDFRLLKFRTMYIDAESKGQITIGNKDPRVTTAGAFLRRYKLDEIPQLFNVLFGDMSLVGPRPEVRKYTAYYSLAHQMILFSVKPGITDYASIEYSKENELLSAVPDPEKFYINEIMPAKIKLNLLFIENPSLGNYLRIIFLTFVKIFNH
jgi:lipopolysaccharide/colanic/teichoic acid biosynthesis glycosyltransferase